MKRFLALFAVLSGLLAQPARSDELRPGYLELRQTDPNTYNLLFKIPARGEDLRLAIYLKLPESAQDVTAPRASFSDGAYVERRTVRRDGDCSDRRSPSKACRRRRPTFWFGSKASPAPSRPNGFHRRGPSSLFRPRPAQERSPRPICASASSTSCSASIIFCSCWRW
jgi:hypothetical protein